MKLPTERTLELFRGEGWRCYVVERFNKWAKVRQDAFGFGDVLAFNLSSQKIALIQCTSSGHHADHLEAIDTNEAAHEWLQAGGWIYLVSWRQDQKSKRWISRVDEFSPFEAGGHNDRNKGSTNELR